MFIEEYGWVAEINVDGGAETLYGPLSDVLERELPISSWNFRLLRMGYLVLQCQCVLRIGLTRRHGEGKKSTSRHMEVMYFQTQDIGRDMVNSINCGPVESVITLRQALEAIKTHLKYTEEPDFPNVY